MKLKVIAALLLICFLNGMCSAQSLIPKIGVTFSNTSWTPDHQLMISYDKGFKSGLCLSIGYEIPLNEWFSFQPSLAWTQKGYSAEWVLHDQFAHSSSTFSYTLDYLEIPLLASLKLWKNRFYFLMGPSIGYGLSGSFHEDAYENRQGNWVKLYSDDSKVRFGKYKEIENTIFFDNKMEMSVQVGLGISLIRKIFIEARYANGFTDLNDGASWKNRVVYLNAGIPIQLKRAK